MKKQNTTRGSHKTTGLISKPKGESKPPQNRSEKELEAEANWLIVFAALVFLGLTLCMVWFNMMVYPW